MTATDGFAGVAVLCVGDVMLDRFISGAVHRISPESPVPVLSVSAVRLFPGGAANVARNVAALGGRCTLLGVVGQDAIAAELSAAIASIDGVTPVLLPAPGRPTTEKMRFVAQGQQLLRADQEDASEIAPDIEAALLAAIGREIDAHRVMVLSDYAKGVLTPNLVRGAVALARARGIPVIVDPKSPDMARYAGATIVTPNAKEVQAATGLNPTDDDAVAIEAGRRILADAALDSVLLTRAHRGMTLVSRHGEPRHLAASAREVFDVVGAGDTVVATLAVALGAGQALPDAAHLANAAAGIVVGKHGTATVTPLELTRELMRLDAATDLPAPAGKIVDADALPALLKAWRREGHAVGLVTGRWDALRGHHVAALEAARSHCGRLVVGLLHAADGADERAALLAGFAAVDAVVPCAGGMTLDLVRSIAPDLLAGDGTPGAAGDPPGADVVRAAGGRVLR